MFRFFLFLLFAFLYLKIQIIEETALRAPPAVTRLTVHRRPPINRQPSKPIYNKNQIHFQHMFSPSTEALEANARLLTNGDFAM